MSSIIWTPAALASEAAPARFELWRAVEAKHVVPTMMLVDTLDEQFLLEDLLESSKPPPPPASEGLHWLLFTPFRYPPPPGGSRFRGPQAPGVFYGADEIRVACAELGYWRWRFLLDAPALVRLDPRQHTLFRVTVEAPTIDLRRAPFDRDHATWTDPVAYHACQTLAEIARGALVGSIRYQSARDPERGGCGAVLSPEAFAEKTPRDAQTWSLSVTRDRVLWRRDDVFESGAWEFDANAFVSSLLADAGAVENGLAEVGPGDPGVDEVGVS